MNKLTDRLFDSEMGDLWIGDINDARERPLDELGIDVVVTVCQDPVEDNISSDMEYYWFDLADGEAADKWGGSSDYVDFREAMSTVQHHVEQGDTVFVHCHHGQSRSAAVCIAVEGAVNGNRGISAQALYNKIEYHFQQKRSMINPDILLKKHAVRYISEFRSGEIEETDNPKEYQNR